MEERKEVSQKEVRNQINTLLKKGTEFKDADYGNLLTIYSEVIGLAQQIDDRSALATGYLQKAQLLWKLAEPVQAQTFYEKSLSIYTELGDYYGIASCYCGMGIIASNNEEYSVALEYFERAIAAAKQAEHEIFTHVLISNVGNVYLKMGRYTDALACYKTAENYYQQTEKGEKLAHVVSGIAGVLVFQGDYVQGFAYLQRALELYRASNSAYGVATVMANMGRVLQKQGKLKKAEQQFLKVLEHARKIKFRSLEYDVHNELSALYSELEMPERSADHLTIFMEGEQDFKREMLQKKNERFRRFGGAVE